MRSAVTIAGGILSLVVVATTSFTPRTAATQGNRTKVTYTVEFRTTGALLDANTRLADAVEQQGKALDGVRALLASQGYTLPPLAETR